MTKLFRHPLFCAQSTDLFGLGCLCLGRCGLRLGSGFPAAAAGSGLLFGCLRCAEGCLVEVYQLDERHVCCVTLTETGLDDACVSAGTVGDLGSHVAEELCHGLFLLQVSEDSTAGVGGVVLRLGDQGLYIHSQCFSLGDGGLDPLVEDERAGHVGQHRLAVTALAS